MFIICQRLIQFKSTKKIIALLIDVHDNFSHIDFINVFAGSIKREKEGVCFWLIQSDLMTAENWLWARKTWFLDVRGKACFDGMDKISFYRKVMCLI